MDVTPQLLKDVEFREKFRGYDPDEVDDFLERVGVAFAQLQDKLREANDQIESANARAAHAEARARDSSDTDDALRGMLLLAQRTADAAVKEAEEQAASIRSDAEVQARQQLTGSEERASQILAAAEAEARRKLDAADGQAVTLVASGETQAEATLTAAREQANRLLMDSRHQAEELVSTARTSADEIAENRRARLAEEVSSLEGRRDALSRNAELLEAHVGVQRSRLQETSDDLRALLENPERLAAAAPPALEPEPPAIVADYSTTIEDAVPAGRTDEVEPAASEPLTAESAEPTTAEATAAESATPESATPESVLSGSATEDRGPIEAGSAVVDLTDEAQRTPADVGVTGFDPGTSIDLDGPAAATDPAPTQPFDLAALEREDASAGQQALAGGTQAEADQVGPGAWQQGAGASSPAPPAPSSPTTSAPGTSAPAYPPPAAPPSTGGLPPAPIVGPSTWPAGGPPPPPPPPPAGRRGTDERAEPPAPPPPPVEVGVGAGSGVPPWLAARTPPGAPTMPPPTRGADSFLDELKRAVGDDETGADSATTTAGSPGATQGSGAEEKSADDTASGESTEGDSSKSWFGRRR